MEIDIFIKVISRDIHSVTIIIITDMLLAILMGMQHMFDSYS